MGDAKAAKAAIRSTLCGTGLQAHTNRDFMMLTMRRTTLLAISFLAILTVTCTRAVENPMNENQKYLKEAREHAKGFEDNLEPELLKQAYLALENVLVLEEDGPEIRGQLRTDSLYLWLDLIGLLDRFLLW